MLTGSPRISRLRFLDPTGQIIDGPADWQPALVEVLVDPAMWRSVRLQRNGTKLVVALQVLLGRERVLAQWPRSGPGWYRLDLNINGESEAARYFVRPAKISDAAIERLIDELERELPVAIALGLRALGGLAGVRLLPPSLTTHAQELYRLNRAVLGHGGRPGLEKILLDLAREPHRILRSTDRWVASELARRPVASRLVRALAAGHNLTETGLPVRVLDAQVDQTYDVYENQLVNSFYLAVARRIARLARIFAPNALSGGPDWQPGQNLLAELLSLQRRLSRARAQAEFLDAVSELTRTPDQVSMVLLNRPGYRAALEAYFEFLRSVWVRLEEPSLEAPLQNFPYLYEVWGTLHVLSALLTAGADLGFTLQEQRLVGREPDGIFVRLVPNGFPAVILRHLRSGAEVSLVPQRAYGTSGELRSMSFPQIPDVSVRVRPAEGPTRLYLFDPKYKLDTYGDAETGDAGPQKDDIDKMHAYRDAIRNDKGERVVRYAAILYPGPTRIFPGIHGEAADVAAISADPDQSASLHETLEAVLARALSEATGAGRQRVYV